MDKSFRQNLTLVIIGVALFAALMNLSHVTEGLRVLLSMTAPIFIGLVIAFILSVPMSGIEKRLRRICPGIQKQRLRAMSLLLTLVLVAAAIALICIMAVPQLVESIRSINTLIKQHWPQIEAGLQQYGWDTAALTGLSSSLDWESAARHLFTGADAILGSVVDLAGSTIVTVTNMLFALVIAVYVLLGSYRLGEQVNRFLDAFLKKQTADELRKVALLVHRTYAKFLSGQCVEVMILGTLIFIAFTVFRIPYAGLTAVLTAAFAFIPYVGAFGSCAIGVLLTLLAEPHKALLCLIVYVTTQFIENQFIYPHVVGQSVGLSALWTLMAAVLGGKLFGVIGIIFFIPLMAVIAELLHEQTQRRLERKSDL